MKFEWDTYKEAKNIKKHKVTFAEASETFFDPHGLRLNDLDHSEVEERYYWIGKTAEERILTTWYTERDEIIRIIGSAELRKFRKIYYENTEIK